MGRLLVAAVVSTACMFPAASFGQPSDTPLDPDWYLVANSEWIVQARLEVPRDKLEQAIRSGKGDHASLTFSPPEIIEIIKRPPGDPDIIIAGCTYWTGPQKYMASPKDILALDGRDVVAFVGPKQFLLQDKGAICLAEPGRADRLRKEVLNQRAIAESFSKLPAAKPDEFEGEVKQLIGKLLEAETQQDAAFALQKLDPRAAPSIIRLMDDRRPLPERLTMYINPPGFFEAYAHYSSGVVTDVLATVLPRLVPRSFGQIFNGGSEEERKQVVDSWHVYLHYQTGDKKKARPPTPAIPKLPPGDK